MKYTPNIPIPKSAKKAIIRVVSSRYRYVYAGLALLVVFSVVVPILDHRLEAARYDLSLASKLLDRPSPKLAGKVSFDAQKELYQFNKDAIKSQGGGEPNLQAGDKGYAADLHKDPSKGITLYDTVNNLSIGFTPEFKTLSAKQDQNRLVYPLESGPKQLVYTMKGNGVKEDLILAKPGKDQLSFSYKLDLGSTLEARLLPSGDVGVYSADPTLFGNISFGSDADRTKVEAARKNGKKTNLVFSIPAPIIKQSNSNNENCKLKTENCPSASFELKDNILTVKASKLKGASYPLSIDPTIVVTSSSDFRNGNNEGGIDFDDTNNQIKRGALTGGTVGAWASDSNKLPFAMDLHALAVASAGGNTYLYAFGGSDSSGNSIKATFYAQINSGGTLGTWKRTTDMQNIRAAHTGVGYNGYIYAIGGADGTTFRADTEYAQVNTDGTIGSWTTTTSFTLGRAYHASITYNGKVYMSGGCTTTANLTGCAGSPQADVQFATFNAGGTLSSWTSTTSLPSGRLYHSMNANNGYIYSIGGTACKCVVKATINGDGTIANNWATNGSNIPANGSIYELQSSWVSGNRLYVVSGYDGANVDANTYYASLDGSGNLGSWQTTTPFSTGRYFFQATMSGSYVFSVGGVERTSVDKHISETISAVINGDGTLGSWVAQNAPSIGRLKHGTAVVNGYLYAVSGQEGNGSYTYNTYYSQINTTNGSLGAWKQTTDIPALRDSPSISSYNGYVYLLGGYLAGTYFNTVSYAKANTDGSLTTWTTLDSSNNFTTGRSYFRAEVANGYMYVMGGYAQTGCPLLCADVSYSDVQVTKLKADGTLTSPALSGCSTVWCATTSMSVARYFHQTAVYNNILYITGGYNNPGTGARTDVQYAQIKSDGSLSAWTTTTALPNSRYGGAGFAANGYLYIVGGIDSGGLVTTVTYYAPIYTNGSVGNGSQSSAEIAGRYYSDGEYYNGYLYVVGGYNNTTQNDVEYAKIDPPGTVSKWTTDTGGNFTTARYAHGTVAYNGYLYVVGGCTTAGCKESTAFLNDVQYAPINNDGTVGTWASAGTGFTTARGLAGVTIYNGYLYVVGGLSDSLVTDYTLQNDIQYAAINSNGTIGTWNINNPVNNFPTARAGIGLVAYNNFMYIVGGCDNSICGNPSALVHRAAIASDGSVGAWTAETSLANARRVNNDMVVVSAGYIYALGGYNGSFMNSIEYAAVTSTGALSSNTCGTSTTWCSATNLPEARDQFDAEVYNGNLYIAGGCIPSGNDCTNKVDNVKYVPINSNGSLGSTWATSNVLSSVRFHQASAIYNGFWYETGGCSAGTDGSCTTLNADTQYAAVNNGGPGTTGAWTQDNTHKFTTARWGNWTGAYNGYLYVMAGCKDSGGSTCSTANTLDDVQFAPLGADGTIGSWTTSSNHLATKRSQMGGAIYNGWLYAVSGIANGSTISTVEKAQIQSNGNIGAFSSASTLNGEHYGGSVMSYNGYIYAIQNSTGTGAAEYAQINADGSIGTWQTTTSFPAGGNNYAGLAHNGYIYMLANTPSYYVQINSNGSLGAWANTNGLILGKGSAPVAAVANGYIYVMGGIFNGSTASSQVEYASINSNGTLGAWQLTTSANTARYYYQGSAYYNGYIYQAGGCSAGSCTNLNDTAEYAPLQSIPRIGTYSRLMDTDVDVTPTKGVIHGSSCTDGTKSLSFQSALNSTPTLGNTQSPSLTFDNLFNLTVGSTKQARYYWLTLTLDDTQCATFPDSSSQQSTITGFDLYYHANTAKRLRGGKTFTGGNQQSLDAQP